MTKRNYKIESTANIITMQKTQNIYNEINNQYKLIDDDTKKSEGVVYTPQYIAKYIVENTINIDDADIYNKKILDPCVGGGIFIIELLSFFHKEKIDLKRIVPNIYGFDINNNRVVEANHNIKSYLKSININVDRLNVVKQDFLKFENKSFDYIIGNPPYINSHKLPNDVRQSLKTDFATTKLGNGNIFYAFVEKSLSLINGNKSKIGFIIPNNLLYIKSAQKLREFLSEGRFVNKIIDFNLNLPFKPIRTYNAIVLLSKNNKSVEFASLDKSDDIRETLNKCKFDTINYKNLNKNAWHLLSQDKVQRIRSLENPFFRLGDLIKTGIATLKDEVYIVDNHDGDYLNKNVDGMEYKIEKNITKDFYKIPEVKDVSNMSTYRKRIIYPYKKIHGTIKLMDEKELENNYPLAYKYLLAQKNKLLSRDSGKIPVNEWYRYGRSQGLNINNNFKIFFKTFNNKPEFYLSDTNDCLFSNGYCVEISNGDQIKDFLKKLNSESLDFYIKNTSYAIEGGYYCYQKKYLENFSIEF